MGKRNQKVVLKYCVKILEGEMSFETIKGYKSIGLVVEWLLLVTLAIILILYSMACGYVLLWLVNPSLNLISICSARAFSDNDQYMTR